MSARRIAVVTGSRADYGLLKPVMAEIARLRGARLLTIATGTHLSRAFGLTEREISADGFSIDARVPLSIAGDAPRDTARAMGAALQGFGASYARLRPDIVVVLGDRYEILSAAAAALPFRIPVAHLHGGESTEGVIDEQIRHAVTKLSHFHFPAAEPYRRRLIAMGERPDRVFCLGAPGAEGLSRYPLLTRSELVRELGLPADAVWGVLAYHPVTLAGSSERELAALLGAAAEREDVFWACSLPNADPGFAPIMRGFKAFAVSRRGKAALFASLGRHRFLSLLKHASVMAGNSSSGILEAPSFGLPAVNVGPRQKGRLRAANVIDVERPAPAALRAALRRALSPAFRRRLRGLKNPYEGRDTCRRIARTLMRVPVGEEAAVKSLGALTLK